MKLTKKAKNRWTRDIHWFTVYNEKGFFYFQSKRCLTNKAFSSLFWEAREHAHQFNYKFTYERKQI